MRNQIVEGSSPIEAMKEDRYLGYMAIAIFVLLSYVLVIGPYIDFTNRVLPFGDPFTYTVGWFEKIQSSKLHYLHALFDIISGGDLRWYRLQDLLIAGFGPLLAKDPAVICIVNYFMWGIATAAIYRLGLYLHLTTGQALIVALVPWIWPTNYGFSDYHAIPVLALDSTFTAALLVAVGSVLVFAINPINTANAVIAALSIGVAIWGRGNSLPVVGLVICAPCLIAFLKARQDKDGRSWFNIALIAVVAGAMIIEYYYTYWAPLSEYYGVIPSILQGHTWTLKDALPYLKNIPGFMYWRHENSPWTMWLSWVSDAVPATAIVVCRIRQRAGETRPLTYLAITGAVIYYGTFLANLALWNDPNISIFNALYIWRPMLIGLSLSVISLFIPCFCGGLRRIAEWRFVPYFCAAFLAWGVLWTAILTPQRQTPAPHTVEGFALTLDQMLGKNGKVAILWFENYNSPILNYYLLKDDLPPLNEYTGPYYGNFWSQTDYSPANGAMIAKGVEDAFRKATLVIIPEYMDLYRDIQPYALYKFRTLLGAWLNSTQAPQMRVLMIVQDSPSVRFLVLQRAELAGAKGEPLHLPWGDRAARPDDHYSSAVIHFQ